MKRLILCAVIFVLLSVSPLLAIDEDAYVRFAADSIIALHKLKGNPNAMELWVKEIERTHPGFMEQDLAAFESGLINDKGRKETIYNRILEIIKDKGYNARLIDLGGGLTTVEILDE